jgi:bifunctional non-homologous end joining protein LigD
MAWSELKADAPPKCRVAEFAHWKERLRHDPWAKLPAAKQQLTEDALAALRELQKKR